MFRFVSILITLLIILKPIYSIPQNTRNLGGSGRQQQRQPQKQQQQKQQQQQQTEYDYATDSVCPEPNGFFADAEQCDKYYECKKGVVSEKLCPDGLVFIDAGGKIEKCEFPFAVDCLDRPKLQPPKKTLNCPRKHGYFAHEDEKICDKFFFCVDGAFNAITCPNGLVFSNATGTCTWPDQAKKQFCSSGELFDFECPTQPEHTAVPHPRYADPKDCQFFYVCIDGKVPRRNGCPIGQVYNQQTEQCDKPKNVPECKDWYKGILDYDEDGEIATTPKPQRTNSGGGGNAGRRKKRPPQESLRI